MREWQDDGAPDVRVLWEKRPTARKPHICTACGEEIAVGEKYEDDAYIVDGRFERHKTHRDDPQTEIRMCPRLADRRAQRLREIEAEIAEQNEAMSRRGW